MKLLFDVTAAEFGIIRDVLATHLGDDCLVWVFGSRAKNTARFNSDLDLAIECTHPLSKQALIALNEAFDEAKLAFSVDVVDLKTVEPYFKSIIDSHKVVFPYPHPNPLPEGEGVKSATNYAVNSLSLGERARVREQNVPQLRFPEFSGEWVQLKLKNIVKINQGLQIPIADRFTEQVEDSYFYITNEFLKEGAKKQFFIKKPSETVLCDENDILMTRTGNTGKVVTNVSGAFHNNFFKIKYDEKVNKIFLVLFLTLNKTQDTIMRLAGTSTIPDLNHGDFYKIDIKLPSLPEQTKIAAFLSAVDTKIDQLTQKKALLETYKKGAMQQIFSQQIRFKAEDGGEYPEWEEKKLGEVGSSYNGLTGKTADDFGEGCPYVQYKQIFDKAKIDISKFGYVSIGENDKQNMVQRGDVFFTVSSETPNEVGYASVLLDQVDNLYLNSFCFGFRPKIDRLIPEFSQFLFRSLDFRRVVIKLAQGSTRYNISKIEFMKLVVKLPTIQEQTKIANFLSAIDRKIDLVSQQLDEAKAFKKGLLQQMFV
jgi:type I restriction enzyme S subunit